MRFNLIEKTFFKEFWKLGYCKIYVLFLKKFKILGIFRPFLFLYIFIFFPIYVQ